MVTADHGNAEKMIAPDGSKHTAHTCNLGMFSIFHNFQYILSHKFSSLNLYKVLNFTLRQL